MKKRVLFVVLNSFFILSFVLASEAVEAFVPQPSHLLHLVMQKIKQPVGLKVLQTKQILNYEDAANGLVQSEEELIYDYPNRLRSRIISNTVTSFSVESDFRFVKIMDGVIVSHDKSAVDLYTDILLYRDHETLLNQLVSMGIDTTNVSFQRYDDMICYVIGRAMDKSKPYAGLWIQKDSFLPVKYVIKKNGWMVEIYYNNWQRVSKTWYPMQISIFLDNQLFVMIHVKSVNLKSGFLSNLFDIDHIEQLYPPNTPESSDQNLQPVDDLDKGIEEFKKLYE